MSRRLPIIFSCGALIICALQLSAKDEKTNHHHSHLSSHKEPIVRTIKMLPSYSLNLVGNSATPLSEGQQFELTATVETQKGAELQYKWIIPDGVRMVGGNLVGTINTTKKSKRKTITAHFVNDTLENKIIHFKIDDLQGSEGPQTAQFHTERQDQILSEIKALEERQRQYIESASADASIPTEPLEN